MQSLRGLRSAALTAMVATGLLAGCVVAPAPGYYNAYYSGGAVTVAPPAVQVETVGVAPTPGYVWFGGYWNWAGGRYVWAPGYWGPGRAGYHWVPHGWVRAGGGWRMARGHWAR